MPLNDINNSDCREKIVSNRYADFLVEYSVNINAVITRYNPDCVQIVDSKIAVIHFRIEPNTALTVEEYGYAIFPKVYGLLDSSNMEESGVLRVHRQPYLDILGRDTIIGIVDTGIDYLHPAFINADNTTRILSIWDQSIQEGQLPEGFQYGSEYTSEQITEAIQSEDPYTIVPSKDDIGHGTFIAGIAAGNEDEANDFTGVAPLASIAVVKLKPAKQYLRDFYFINSDAICYQENDVLMGIKYLLSVARRENKPLVICVGVGTNSGSHDGTSFVSDYLDRVGNALGTAITTAAGNEGNREHHYSNSIAEGQSYQDVEIKVGSNETGFALELWATAPNTFAVGFTSPSGEYIDRIPARLGQSERVRFLLEPSIIYVDYRIIEARTGDQLIFMRFQNPVEGIWRIRVFRETPYPASTFNMWLPMEGFTQPDTVFVEPDPFITLTEPATARIPITVATYNHVNGSIYINSSRGYTRTGEIKPDITAPGVNVFGPVPGGGYAVRTGSSIAAAHAAGGAALLLEWGIIDGNDVNLTSTDIKKYYIRGANRTNIEYPNRIWGYGTMNLYNSFESLRTTE